MKIIHSVILMICLGWAGSVLAENVVKVGFKSGKAPYVMATKPFKDSDYNVSNNLGIEIDIFREALAPYNIKVVPVYMNYNRMPQQMIDGQIMAAGNMQKGVEGVAYVDGYLRLSDYMFYAKSLDRELTSIKDMNGLRVLAFQQAERFLGDAYRDAIPSFSSYREIDDQEKQVKMFFAGRTDVVVGELGIFKHWAKKYGVGKFEYDSAPIFDEPLYFSASFNDPKLRDQFAEGLENLKKSGRYDEIYAKYLD